MNDVDSINQEYQSYLQSLDDKTKTMILVLLAFIKEVGLADGNYTYGKQVILNKAIYDFKKSYTDLLTNGADEAIQYAKDLKKAEFDPYIDDVEKRLSWQNISIVEVATIMHALGYSQISPVFNGSRDTDIVNKVWYKNWSDGLTVSDRVNRLSSKTGQYIEHVIKHGVVAGESSKKIEKKINDHFINGSEQKAMMRLAIHTVNMVYETAAAEIVNDALMIKGIRVMRSPAGSDKCRICVEHAGEVGGSGVEYLKENGDSLDVLANMPPYHAYCMCDVELIFIPVEEMLKQLANDRGQKYTEEKGGSDKWFDDDGNPIWPPMNGFASVPRKRILQIGTMVDRYGDNRGTYVSPQGVSFEQRSLPPDNQESPYNIYEVIKELEVLSGDVSAWFGYPGGGLQYKLNKSIRELLREGYIRKVDSHE